ncbi:MAG: sigma-70 family RNA polymerase sigma factor [Candidatus Brocadiales bacterium]|nr:sigma-70 family RNA polymerase sigma factor [Candidatus Brocadiales bacterium]
MKLFQKGVDENTFTRLVEEYGQQVYNIAAFTVQDEMLAEDITQEVFIKIYRKISDFRGEAKLSTWIYRITINTCYNHLKRDKKYRKMDEMPTHLSDGASPEMDLLRNDLHTAVRNAVGTLPKVQRMAISLYYFHDRSYVEIAEIMSIPMNTLKSHIYRAKQTLKTILNTE